MSKNDCKCDNHSFEELHMCTHEEYFIHDKFHTVRFEVWAFSFSSRRLSRLSCINEYLAIYSGGHVSE